MAEGALNRVIGMNSQPYRPVLMPNDDDASGHILDNIIDYLMNATDATTDNNFVPRMMGPALPQAEITASGKGTSNDAMTNRIVAHHAVAVELLQERLGSMPTSSEAALPGSAPSGVDESIDIDTMH